MNLQLHPLRDSTWGEIFPIITYFLEILNIQNNRPTTKAQEFLRNEAVILENQRQSSVVDLQSRKPGDSTTRSKRTFCERISEFNDPQRALGAGISSYHQQLVHLFFLFLILFGIHVPVLTIYNTYSFYDSSFLNLSLGNMGFSTPKCLIEGMSAAAKPIKISCQSGSIS